MQPSGFLAIETRCRELADRWCAVHGLGECIGFGEVDRDGFVVHAVDE